MCGLVRVRRGGGVEVEVGGAGGKRENHVFDKVVFASSFNARPKPAPEGWFRGCEGGAVAVRHSSDVKGLGDVLPEWFYGDGETRGEDSAASSKLETNPGQEQETNRILIVGGGNSAGECVSQTALLLSSALQTPTPDHAHPSPSPNKTLLRTLRITHITPRPFYPIPRLLPNLVPPAPSDSQESKRETQAPFIPADALFFNFSNPRGDGPIVSGGGCAR